MQLYHSPDRVLQIQEMVKDWILLSKLMLNIGKVDRERLTVPAPYSKPAGSHTL